MKHRKNYKKLKEIKSELFVCLIVKYVPYLFICVEIEIVSEMEVIVLLNNL